MWCFQPPVRAGGFLTDAPSSSYWFVGMGSSTEERVMAIPNTYQDQTVILGKQAINLEVL